MKTKLINLDIADYIWSDSILFFYCSPVALAIAMAPAHVLPKDHCKQSINVVINQSEEWWPRLKDDGESILVWGVTLFVWM